MSGSEEFWESVERVEDFAARAPDRRLLALLDDFARPEATRVLDLGCAGGRNTVVLAELGFDFHAIDASLAMVAKTRERVSSIVGTREAQQRVRVGRMEDLGAFGSGSFELVVALGVYHGAADSQVWDRALNETARVLVPGGQLLVANFSPASDPEGKGLRPVAGTQHLFEGFDAGPLYLLDADELDLEMVRHSLLPIVPTTTVTVPTESGSRVTVNGLYRRQERSSQGSAGDLE